MLDGRKTFYQHSGETISYNIQFKRLTWLKRQSETRWLKTIHSQVLQEPIKNLRRAFQNFALVGYLAYGVWLLIYYHHEVSKHANQ